MQPNSLQHELPLGQKLRIFRPLAECLEGLQNPASACRYRKT